jgi:TRAP-type C4-dicarboxylate transport system substrate-binding protein
MKHGAGYPPRYSDLEKENEKLKDSWASLVTRCREILGEAMEDADMRTKLAAVKLTLQTVEKVQAQLLVDPAKAEDRDATAKRVNEEFPKAV